MFRCDFEWQSAPGVRSSALAATWARVEFWNGDETITKFWSEPTQAVRKGFYSSLLPLASWLARNWWVLWNEGAILGDLSGGPRECPRHALAWFRRHNIFFAREGMAYPDLSIVRLEDQAFLSWRADPHQSDTPGRFLEKGDALVSLDDTKGEFRRIIDAVIERTREIDDPMVSQLRDDWHAVNDSMVSEEALCSRLGTMGIDPYEGGLEPHYEELIASLDFERGVLHDLLSVTSLDRLADNANAVRMMYSVLGTQSSPRISTDNSPRANAQAYSLGFKRANWLRQTLGLDQDSPIRVLDQVTSDALGSDFMLGEVDTGYSDIEAAVESNGAVGAVLCAGMDSTSRRFHIARALHHALFVTTDEHPVRLLTKSHEWQQSASRSFAAELLAPAEGLAARLRGLQASTSDELRLAEEFEVAPRVIQLQLVNHGLS